MKQQDAYEKVIIEYLSKCREYGCDSCFAEFYCIENGLRTGRFPDKNCINKIKWCLKDLKIPKNNT